MRETHTHVRMDNFNFKNRNFAIRTLQNEEKLHFFTKKIAHIRKK